eukprot:6094967-Prymnesium_polylepis.2
MRGRRWRAAVRGLSHAGRSVAASSTTAAANATAPHRACESSFGATDLRAVLRDAARLRLAPHHEARDVLHKEQRHAALAAQLHKVRTLDGRVGLEHSRVRDDSHTIAVHAREAGDLRGRARHVGCVVGRRRVQRRWRRRGPRVQCLGRVGERRGARARGRTRP